MLDLDKIYNMDCIEGMKQIDDDSIDLVLTDPPYGITKAKWDIEVPPQKVLDDCLRISKYGVLWFGGARTDVMKKIFEYVPYPERIIIWNTPFSLCSSRKNGLMYKWHPIYCWGNFKSTSLSRDIISINAEGHHEWNHPTTKPLKLMIELIKSFSKDYDIIIDPFMGSGTTAIACKQLNRHFIGFELSKEYCDIANKRLKNVPVRLDKFQEEGD